MELTCRFDLRKGVFFIQPGFEYIIRPGGTGRLKNVLVFGTQFGINF
jgi:carbohydrate-selective porin OprB